MGFTKIGAGSGRQKRKEEIMGRVEHIGDATLYLGDCLEILPTLDKVE